MAAAGIASRRKSEEIIAAGRVKVNGKTVRDMGVSVDLNVDKVQVDGRVLHPQRHLILAMNKPRGVVTTMSDELGRKTVADLLPDMEVTLKPVGRLDKDSEGLLLFTNDGDLSALLTHPKHGVWKAYHVIAKGQVTMRDIEELRRGVWIPIGDAPRPGERRRGKKTSPAKAELMFFDPKRGVSGVEISIHEGAKRQVRLMLESLGKDVTELKRTKFGPISLGKLPPGACRMLSKSEETKLRREASSGVG